MIVTLLAISEVSMFKCAKTCKFLLTADLWAGGRDGRSDMLDFSMPNPVFPLEISVHQRSLAAAYCPLPIQKETTVQLL